MDINYLDDCIRDEYERERRRMKEKINFRDHGKLVSGEMLCSLRHRIINRFR